MSRERPRSVTAAAVIIVLAAVAGATGREDALNFVLSGGAGIIVAYAVIDVIRYRLAQRHRAEDPL